MNQIKLDHAFCIFLKNSLTSVVYLTQCSIPVADALGVDATAAVHVGDDPTNDKQGALAAGLESWYCTPYSTILPIFFLFIISDEMLTLLRLS